MHGAGIGLLIGKSQAPAAPTILQLAGKFEASSVMNSSTLPQETDPLRCEVVQIGAAAVRGEKARTLKLARELPEGLSIGQRLDGRKMPFFLRSGRDRKVSSFTTERERNDTVAALWAKQKEAGVGVLDEFDGALWRKMTDLLKRTGATPEQLEAAWMKSQHNGGSAVLLSDSVAKYVALRTAEGLKEKTDTYRHLRKHLMVRLVAALGDYKISDITADHLRTWAVKLVDDDGKPVSELTRRHHLISAKTFFKRAATERWIERDPSEAVILPKVEEDDVNLMAVRDAFHFFKVNRDHRAIGRLALEAFGGLRYKSAGKIQEDDLRFEERGIYMPGRDHKSGKRKFRQGQPANVWAWLKHAPKECWTLTLRQYADEKTEMHVSAGLRPMVLKSKEDRDQAKALHNVWRHSFASYLLAETNNAQAVGRLMQHSRQSTTEGYEGVAREQHARLYFAITPESVLLTWDEFAQQLTPPAKS